MRLLINCLFYCLFFVNLSVGYADSKKDSEWFSNDASQNVTLNVNLFLSSTCENCHKADLFFHEIERQFPWLSVHRYVVNEDKLGLKLFYKQLKHIKSDNFSVPTLFFCDSRWLGFYNEETTGKGVLRALNYCHQQVLKEGQLTPLTVKTLRQWSGSNSFDTEIDLDKTGLTPFQRLLTTALAEAITPCSLFCLLMFISFLWATQERRLMQLLIGLVFIVTLCIIRFLQFAVTPQYQNFISHGMLISLLSGAVLLLYVYFHAYAKLRTGVQRHVGWIFPVLIMSVVAVYVNQQDCSFSVGAFFSRWLLAQPLTPAAYYFYQISYLSIYMAPLMLVLIVFLLINTRPRYLLSYSANFILVSTGFILLIYPSALANYTLSCCILFFSLLFAWLVVRRKNKLLR